MSQGARLIEQIKGILEDVEPETARRVVDYFATTYRAELNAAVKKAAATQAKAANERSDKPSFLHTEHRIERGEILLELERRGDGKKGR